MSEKVSVSARIPGGDPIAAIIEIDRFTQGQRTGRALKVLAICWVGAVLAVFIPILHFVLVPLLFISGPIAASLAYKKTQKIVAGKIHCPNCEAVFQLKVGPVTWPQREICASCRHHLVLEVSS